MIDETLIQQLMQESGKAFDHTIKRKQECLVNITARYKQNLDGAKLAQHLAVVPFYNALVDVLPKPVLKKVFKEFYKKFGDNIDDLFSDRNASDSYDIRLGQNRTALKQMNIPKEQWEEYGGDL